MVAKIKNELLKQETSINEKNKEFENLIIEKLNLEEMINQIKVDSSKKDDGMINLINTSKNQENAIVLKDLEIRKLKKQIDYMLSYENNEKKCKI